MLSCPMASQTGISVSCSASPVSMSPFSAASQSSTEACGAALRIAAIEPRAPSRYEGQSSASTAEKIRLRGSARRIRSAKSFMSPALCLTPDARNLLHDAQQKVRGKIAPRHHVVDQDRQSGRGVHLLEVAHHRVVVGAE